MFKNQTPQQLAFFVAFIASLSITLALVLIDVSSNAVLPWQNLVLAGSASFFIVYFTTYYWVRYYIFRRIKLIYKIIHRQKLSSDFKADKIIMQQNILDDVEKEVGAWSEKHDQELEELEGLANYRRRFIGDVSHELKTPIFNIQGFIHTLLDGAVNDPEVNIQYLQRAAKNVDRLQAIVEDLETINKLEAGQMILDLSEFDIYELATEVFSDLEMRAANRNIKLMFKEGAGQHFKVRADKDSIHQVLMNLTHNSIKYGKDGGATKISFYDMESYVLVEVSDNGIGIPEEHLNHVFDRFFRADKSRSRDVGGTGLGLSIVKHIVEAHKQTVNVRSTPEKGSTFGFTLEKA